MDKPTDDKAGWEAEFAREREQLEASVGTQAGMAYAYFHALTQSGLMRKEALALTKVWVKASMHVFRSITKGQDGGSV